MHPYSVIVEWFAPAVFSDVSEEIALRHYMTLAVF
jgi:hypothetical protein